MTVFLFLSFCLNVVLLLIGISAFSHGFVLSEVKIPIRRERFAQKQERKTWSSR